MIYLKKFETAAEYTAAESGLILPNVSLITENNTVHYKPLIVPTHEYVDLGLPSGTKWATMNIGATSETDYGLYFQWGDTQGYTASEVGSGEGKKYFGWADYKYNSGGTNPSASDMTKYNSTDGKTVLDAEDDAAQAAWGGSWRIPTEAEFTELLDNTDSEWTTVDGVNGYKFTHKNDNTKYVFFPAAGHCRDGSRKYVGNSSNYLSSSLSTSDNINNRILAFANNYCSVGGGYRSYGFSVRGVMD